MTLIEDYDIIQDHCFDTYGEEEKTCKTALEVCNAGIVVWQHNLYIVGPCPSTYHVIQVVDGTGKKLAT